MYKKKKVQNCKKKRKKKRVNNCKFEKKPSQIKNKIKTSNMFLQGKKTPYKLMEKTTSHKSEKETPKIKSNIF